MDNGNIHENGFIKDFLDSLNQSDNAIDTGVDYAELFLDTQLFTETDIFKNSGLKDIPIIKTIISTSEVINNIYQRNLLKQTATFIREFNKGGELSEKSKKHIKRLKSNPKRMYDELGRVLILINRNVDSFKTECEARFLRAYYDDEIVYDDFVELCDIIDNLFVEDLQLLKNINETVVTDQGLIYKYNRLIAVGILYSPYDHRGGLLRYGVNENLIKITNIGKLFCKYVFLEK